MMSRALKTNVVVVEDEKIASLNVQKILQNWGHTVTSISFPGGEALKKLERLEKISKLKNLKDIVGNEKEERLSLFMDSGTDSFLLLDSELNVVEINKTGLKNYDLFRKDLVGKNILDLIPALKKRGRYDKYMKVIKTGESYFEDCLAIHPKAGDRFINLKAFKVGDGLGMIITDTTDHRLAEEELKKSQEELRSLSLHLQSVREGESTRIAREIHDELGHMLTALKMDLSWLNKRLTNGQKPLVEKTRSMSKLTDMIIQTVQRISTELRPVILDDLGLVPAIEWQAQEFENRTNIKCETTIDCGDIDLDQDRSTALFRIFQEALTNVARHAKATKIKVSLKEKPGKLLLKIKDDGQGITEEQVSDPKSLGLIGIRERIYPWGGEVKIKGLSKKGTALTVILPTT
jgi:PAS domain S-box-containing protein